MPKSRDYSSMKKWIKGFIDKHKIGAAEKSKDVSPSAIAAENLHKNGSLASPMHIDAPMLH